MTSKLDIYDYLLMPGVIRIRICGASDPILVDVLSELDKTEGRIYVEGLRFKYLDSYKIILEENESFLDLDVMLVDHH